MNTPTLIRTTALRYRYGKDAEILSGINLAVPKGSIYGFLGPNGSGKTTTLSLLLGLLKTQSGSIEIFGQDLQTDRIAVLKKIGSLIEAPSVYGHLSAAENLEVYRPLYGLPKSRIAEVLRTVGLHDTGRKKAKAFSLGMKQRLAIALALLPNPELLILDEPSNGLDPGGIIELRQLVKTLNAEHGMTILISSHLLSEVERMVSHVGIVYKGEMLFQGTLAELHAFQQRGTKLHIHTSDNESACRLLQPHGAVLDEDRIALPFQNLQQVALINRTLTQHNLDVYVLHPQRANLEQLFIDLTTQPA